MTERLDFPSADPPARPIDLGPCPFCEGPPVLSCHHEPAQGVEDGINASGWVWCHECGAKGPHAEAMIFDMREMWGVKTRAAEIWNVRDARHRGMYDAGTAGGLHTYPRVDGRDVPR